MKAKYIFFSLVALCMLSACTKDEEVAITTVQINNLSIAPQYTRSAFACDLVANSPIVDVELQYSTDSLFGEGLYQTLQLNQNEHHYTANLESLQQGQTYYVRYKVFNSFNSMIPTRVDTFRTRAYTVPSVRTDSVTHITTHSADCYFTLTDWGCDSLPIVGVCFSTSLSDRTNIPCTTTLSDSTFVCSLSDLTDGKTYSVYAFAKNAQGTAYSEKVITFTTIAIVPPTVVTSDVTAISYTSAVCGGDISSDGNAEVTERGICYGTTAQPTTKDSVILCGSGTGAFSIVLPNLQDGVTYYVRAYATNGKGTAYGEQKTFVTSAYSLPTLTTAEVTNISYTTAICGGNITSAGGQTITTCGICYSTKSNSTIADSKVIVDNGIGSFSCNLTGLSDGTTYYVRAYATNSKGTAYGAQKKFTTTDYSLPTLTTADATSISHASATCGGNITSDGGQTVTSRGICYSTKSNPTIADKKVIVGSGTGAFTCNLTALTAATTYYVRSYAVNSKGTAYGEQKVFTTDYSIPKVSTLQVSDISFSSAVCSGEVVSTGGLNITSCGICYSTTSNPTIADNIITANINGLFSCKLINLLDGVTYYIRAYAINSKGVAYGEISSFKTIQQPYFSVGENKFVVFAPGNLQYRASTDTYRFAENQFDRIGYANENISDNYDGWIDLFGWGTGNMPTDTVHEDNPTYKTFVDWGKNSIGIYPPNTWYTPTLDEFYYVVNERNNAKNLIGYAKVNDVNGIILLPDNWMNTNNISFSSYYTTSTRVDNVYDLSEWHTLENTGAIFLPATGLRRGDSVSSVNTWGGYWISTPWQGGTVKFFMFTVSVREQMFYFYGNQYFREEGCSVRLVRKVVK